MSRIKPSFGGSIFRSQTFQDYLNTQPRARADEIRAAEYVYDQQHARGLANDPAMSDYEDSFFGYVEQPAGHS